MITPAYCVAMADYNIWQNASLARCMGELDEAALWQDRGAFFGSILATANHILWGDLLWIGRFDGGAAPGGTLGGMDRHSGVAGWKAERDVTDTRLRNWAQEVTAEDLALVLNWHSKTMGRDMVTPVGLCVMHLFNHQTHHRGQIHAMLTAAGVKPDDTDLPFMPGLE